MKDVKGTKEEDKTPPAWFTSYMEKVRTTWRRCRVTVADRDMKWWALNICNRGRKILNQWTLSFHLRPPPPSHPSLQFKDQVVREAVEKICREFSGQCCIHKPLGGGAGGGGGGRGEAAGGAEAQQVPEVSSSTLPGAPSSSTPPCSSCRGQTTGGGYQCRYVMSTANLLIVALDC